MKKIPLLLILIKEFLYRSLALVLANLVRLFIRNKATYKSIGYIELYVLLLGPRAVFDSGFEIREHWENIRLNTETYCPYAPSHLNGLEVSYNILSRKSTTAMSIFYLMLLLLVDESSHDGNHAIGCYLAKSSLLRNIGLERLSRRNRYFALKKYKLFKEDFFYNEGSTHYHIFTTYLFALYYSNADYTRLFQRSQLLNEVLISSPELHFGDRDPFPYDDVVIGQSDRSALNVIRSAFVSNYFYYDEFFSWEVYIKLRNDGRCGHELDQVGDFRLVFDRKVIVGPIEVKAYTRNLAERTEAKLNSRNGYIETVTMLNRYFAPVVEENVIVTKKENSLLVTRRGKTTELNFYEEYFGVRSTQPCGSMLQLNITAEQSSKDAYSAAIIRFNSEIKVASDGQIKYVL